MSGTKKCACEFAGKQLSSLLFELDFKAVGSEVRDKNFSEWESTMF
jgi:hypothetical protein